ncbi:ubiquitin carboxyl-terminal hydrolase 3-like isoform X2 [Episyrphus balteatus]|uniref:ubiquitin carboxyl-terminal hydrolase 3-like isoform X2 n=1 Tax=Episyrphus balteatus TaxID=286459 RepID=UPI0024865FEF|nr:ubiquitin carboxyl-terminal hydrolase 3-like isoform X2 [Episyrphus balteatus]
MCVEKTRKQFIHSVCCAVLFVSFIVPQPREKSRLCPLLNLELEFLIKKKQGLASLVMDCPHLNDNCKINRGLIRSKKCQLIDGRCTTTTTNTNPNQTTPSTESGGGVGVVLVAADSTSNSSGSVLPLPVVVTPAVTVSGQHQSQQQQKLWKCSECKSEKNNWICLHCGAVLCGRYEKAHALSHFKAKNHKVCMNTLDYSVFCYKCDDFVINETNSVEEIRQELKSEDDSCSETSSSSKSQQETASVSSNDSGWEDTPKPGRKLRPRKRTISSESGDSAATPKRKSLRKVVGLRNLGNTCFMNSVLQSLSHIKEFSCYFNALPCLEPSGKQKQQRVYCSRSLKESMSDANVVEELRKVLLNLSKGGDGSKAISPECLFLVIWKVVPQFRGHRQHDAHEFLRYMLDRLHTELQHLSIDVTPLLAAAEGKTPTIIGSNANSNYKGGRSSIVTNVFGGTLQSEVRCLICGMESKKHDPFLDLSLDIPEKFYKECVESSSSSSGSNGGSSTSPSGNSSTAEPKVKPLCNISDCLSSFTEVEELAQNELYYCSSCKCKQRSTKRFWIRRLPNVLCLHIKRFRWNNFFRTKLDLRISFPIKSLDMSQYVLNNMPETRRTSQSCNVYDLAAVIVHHGNGSSCGHYTSFAINNGTWLHFNDHTVKEVPSSAVAECKPYILFYIRRDINGTTINSLNIKNS